MNDLDLSLEKEPVDSILYEQGLIAYQNIKRNIRFILPSGLRLVSNYLNENGRLVYKRFEKLIEQEIKGEN